MSKPSPFTAEDNRLRISADGIGRVSFDPLGLSATKYEIVIPQSLWDHPEKDVELVIQKSGGDIRIKIKDAAQKI